MYGVQARPVYPQQTVQQNDGPGRLPGGGGGAGHRVCSGPQVALLTLLCLCQMWVCRFGRAGLGGISLLHNAGMEVLKKM